MITFLLLGNQIHRVPGIGRLVQFDYSLPTSEHLYLARKNAATTVDTEYFSIVDGGPDLLLPSFEKGMFELCETMSVFPFDIGTTRERINGRLAKYFHHGIVCRKESFMRLTLPESGCYAFEHLVYPMLSKNGVALCDVDAYDWIPSINGAAKWPDSIKARINSKRFLNGLGPVPDLVPACVKRR